MRVLLRRIICCDGIRFRPRNNGWLPRHATVRSLSCVLSCVPFFSPTNTRCSWLKDFGYYNSETGLYNITAGATTCIYGVMLGFAFLASLGSGWFGTYLGRKWGLIFCAITGFLGSGLQMVPHYGVMVVGKAFSGMSLGSAGIFAISYWSETAPAKMRGMIVTLYQININIPNLIGACIDQGTYQWSTRWSYWLPLLVTMFPPLVLVLLVWLIPESPRESPSPTLLNV